MPRKSACPPPPSAKTKAASAPNRLISPACAASPSTSCAPTAPPTSAENSTSTHLTQITQCHTG
jgi:hypothetical protein